MSKRARAYVTVAAVRHVALGLACLIIPASFTSPSYEPIKSALFIGHDAAMTAWGWTILFLGALCTIPATTGQVRLARIGLLLSVILTAMWFGGFVWAICIGISAGPLGMILLAALVAKDLIMLGDPMRTPFEDHLREVIAKNDRR